MDDDASDPGEESAGSVGELLAVFGPVRGSGLAGELGEARDGPSWRRVDRDEMVRLLAAYREVEALEEDLMAALEVAGLSADEFPELRGSVDGHGCAVVQLGEVSAATGARLVRVLRASPIPPAGREKAA